MNILNDIKTALRNLPRRGQHNLAKIVCLTLGLAVSSVIIAEIYFEQTYDTYMKDWKRTYQVNEDIVQDGEYKVYDQTPGAIAHGLRRYSPQVEAATRYTWVNEDVQVEVGRRKGLKADVILADSCIFDVLPRPVLQGDARQVLSRPRYCLVSSSFAERAGGNVVGKRLTGVNLFGENVTIGGVFEDYPENSSLRGLDVMISMPTIHAYPDFDGSENWMGNDRYNSYVRLRPGVGPEDLKPDITQMINDNLPVKRLKENGIDFRLSLTNISKDYTDSTYVKRMYWILSIEAAILLFASVMNYLLIVVGNMVTRSREMAVRKCFGAGRGRLFSIVFSEAFVHLVISMMIAMALIFACKGAIENFLSAPLEVLIFNRGAWILILVCVVVLLVGGLVPGWLYSRIPVATAFRGYNTARYRWKPVLLAAQFIAAGMLFSLLFVINSQYNRMVDADSGYDYDNLAVLNVDGIGAGQRAAIIQELRRMPEVGMVSSADCLPLNNASGNNVRMPGSDKDLFNVCDFYSVSDDYLKLMGIELIEGRGLNAGQDSLHEVIVSEDFVPKFRNATHFKGSLIGKNIIITEHGDSLHPTVSICGVYKKIRSGSAAAPDNRPSVMFYSKAALGNIMIRFHKMTAGAMQKVREKFGDEYPDREVTLQSYPTMMTNQYQSQASFRGGVLVSGIVILVIALLGLVGYTVDEVNRRSKEIAIRKVNGARVADILRLFIRTTMLMAVPSVLAGCVIAWLISGEWLKSFAERITLTPLPFLVAAVLILIVVAAVVVWNCRKVARSNPIGYLKDL